MDAKEHARFFVDGVFVVGNACAVGRADFAEAWRRFRHDFGDAEAVADFDQLAARDDDFAVARECGKNEKHGGGAVVDDDGGFGAGQPLRELRGVDVALAARAGFEIVFKIGVLRGGAAEFFDDGFGERRAAKIGVKDDAGGVDDRLKRSGEDLLDGVGDLVLREPRGRAEG